MSSDEVKMWTGLHKEQFDDLFETSSKGHLRSSKNRSQKEALFMLLMVLRRDKTNPVMLSFFQPGNYVVVDRDFRDVVDETKSHGIEVYMPNLLKHGKQQFTSSESNESRKVTALRFIVETVNGRLKNVFKFLSGRVEAAYGPDKIWNFFQICCAILNKNYGPILTDKPRHRIVVEACHSKLQALNKLEREIQEKNLLARSSSQWIRINLVDLPEFFILTMDNLLEITLGPY
ncbi:hypothetical protein ILUMI_19607 [Ignelater luminosus]|uniref:DDE Tnp4 domain-containing protein n=1 Tax=Ignelater luminosus TaxID=2038154 RepID=A0A8K0CM35_IGNLU|nr:hypothetical protein ILUMI_19607 [Ignelater luminosus]